MRFSLKDAQKKLPKLIRSVERGYQVTICRRGMPVANLVRTTATTRKKPKFGTPAGQDQNTRSGLVEADDGRASGCLFGWTLLNRDSNFATSA
jgi:antitoxin (DNA-binding transcriptional repressor) of toxin-antitoxin stability system